MSNAEKYAAARVNLYKAMFSGVYDTREREAFRQEADALWPLLSEAEKREGERGYFYGVQEFNRRDPNYKGVRT